MVGSGFVHMVVVVGFGEVVGEGDSWAAAWEGFVVGVLVGGGGGGGGGSGGGGVHV